LEVFNTLGSIKIWTTGSDGLNEMKAHYSQDKDEFTCVQVHGLMALAGTATGNLVAWEFTKEQGSISRITAHNAVR
jgi:hypothetical protein